MSAVCNTPGCLQVTDRILQTLVSDWESWEDDKICNDLTTFACGGIMEGTNRPDSYMGTLEKGRRDILKEVLSGDVSAWGGKSSDEGQLFLMVKDSYDACMDTKAAKEVGDAPVVEMMEEVAKLFPVDDGDFDIIRNWGQQRKFSWSMLPHGEAWDRLTKAQRYLGEKGVDAFVSVGHMPDLLHGAAIYDEAIVIDSAPLPLGRGQRYAQKSKRDRLAVAVEAVLRTMHPVKKAQATAKALAYHVVYLEEELSGTVSRLSDMNNLKEAERITRAQLRKVAPFLGLDKLVDDLAPLGYNVDSNLISVQPKFLGRLKETLGRTPKAILQAYFVWRTAFAFSVSGANDALEKVWTTTSELTLETSPRGSEKCLEWTRQAAGDALSYLYLTKALPHGAKASKAKVLQMAEGIKQELTRRIDKSALASKDKQWAAAKAKKMAMEIGWRDEDPDMMDAGAVLRQSKDVKVKAGEFLANVVAEKARVRAETVSVLRDGVPASWAYANPVEMTAFFSPDINAFYLTAPFLHFPALTADMPAYILAGGLGSIIGHEISHGFDSQGSMLDGNGKILQEQPWTPATQKLRKNLQQCFVKQYDKIPVLDGAGTALSRNKVMANTHGRVVARPAMNNGQVTLAENEADANGLALAWGYYQAGAGGSKSSKKEPDLPNPKLAAKFSHEKLFYIAWAQSHCSHAGRELALDSASTGEHASFNARIVGAAANSRGFRQLFCGEEKKKPVCGLWDDPEGDNDYEGLWWWLAPLEQVDWDFANVDAANKHQPTYTVT